METKSMKQDRPDFYGPDDRAVAVIGLSCLFPGSGDVDAYWRVIKNGLDAIGDIPADHWATADYYDPDPKAEDKTYGKRGGFLSPVDFEPLKYGIVPNDISAIDTTQLLGLVAADRALKDAGYGADSQYDHNRTAVLLGVTGALKMVVSLGSRLAHPQLKRSLEDSGLDAETIKEVLARFAAEFTPWQENSFPGLLGNVTAGRIANRLNLGGSNLVVDAACASSLAAVRQSMMELLSGQADLVVTGGVDTFSDPFMYTCFSKTPALSPTGDVRAYDQNGDGTMLGEGIGVLVLKRLADAKRDGDHIYAVIRSVGSSSDGKGAAIFAPTPDGQMRALTNAYENAGVAPESIELIEGHGTGTAVGDAVEVEALARVFAAGAPKSSRTPWCALGSVKSQIGHTKAAAGSAGLIKSILAIYNKTLPPTVKVERPLPILNTPDSPFYIAASARPWISAGPRRAGVSAFGFGGSNFHCVVEEAEGGAKTAVAPADLILLALSGTSRESLAAQLATAACADDLERAAAESRNNFSGREPFRLLIAAFKDQFASIVEQSLECLSRPGPRAAVFPAGAFYSDEPAASGAPGFLVPGPDSVRQNMFKDLTADRPELIDALSLAAKNLAAEAPELPPLGLVLYPPELASPEAAQKWSAALADPRLRRASAGAVTEGLIKILEKFGLKPAAILGGESADLAREMNREDARAVNLWLEVGPGCEMSLAALAAFGDSRQVLALDQGEGGHIDLACFLARLAVLGVPVNLAAWPAALTAADETKTGGFTVPVSGANSFNKKKIPPSPPKTAAAPMAAASTGNGRGLAEALEAMTAESARLHQAFLDQQSQAMQLIRQSLGDNSPAASAPAPAVSAAPVAPISSRPAPLPDSGSTIAPNNDAITATVMQVVGAETGYPVEMLNLSMDLEADLGLDSIKKVEIMAVLGEKFPEIQGLGAETMSRASTLGDLAALVGPAAFAETPSPALFTAPPAAAPGGQSSDVWPILREVVSSETGYPQEMLRPEMSLSEDLGLDSIKMVEIASLMNERLPSAQAVGADAISGSQTLADLTVALGGGAMAYGAMVSAASAPAAPPAGSKKSSDAAKVVLEIVSSETGYPVDMLRLDMSLEAGLGLDSIKKVEIMAALSERLPEAESLGSAEIMSGLETLGDLAALVGSPSDAAAVQPTAVTSTVQAEKRAAAAPPAPAGPGADMGDALLDVVAAETGYPREMLNFNASLEADLGLDSIKKVEIMAALSEKLGDDSLAASSADVLSRAVTLGDLRELLKSTAGKPLPGNAQTLPAAALPAMDENKADGQAAEQTREIKKRRPGRPPKNSPPAFILKEDEPEEPELERTAGISSFKIEMKPINLSVPGPESFFAKGGPLLIAANPGTLTEALEKEYGRDGREVQVVPWFRLGQLQPSDSFSGIILVWPGADNNYDLPGEAFKALKTLGPALLRAAEAGRKPLVGGLTFMGGSFGFDGRRPFAPASAGLVGLLKTLAREWPGVKVKAVDLPLEAYEQDAPDFLPALEAIWADSGAEVEIGSADGRSFSTPALRPYKLKNIRVRHIKEGQTIVVTGGARGVTAAALKELAGSFRPHLVILGRTPIGPDEPGWLKDLKTDAGIRQAIFERAAEKPTPKELARESAMILANREIKANLAAMEKAGAKVTYISGDFQKPQAIKNTLDEIKRLHAPIRGFIHGAGVLADSLILDKKAEDFDLVFNTKAKMAGQILAELSGQPLSLVAFFSSSTARFGRRGQADYAAGNEVLNKLAAALAEGRQGPKCLSLNWGPWAGGMVDAGLARLFEDEGIGLIPLDEGARLFAAMAGGPKNDPVEVVVLGPGTDMSALN